MSLQRVPCMILALCSDVGLVRFFGGWKRAEMQSLGSRQGDPRLELVAENRYAKITRSVIGSRLAPVLSVFQVAGQAKVADAVVVNNAVLVVYNGLRMFAVNVKPCEAMRSIRHSVNSDANVSVVPQGTSFVASLSGASSVDAPSEDARLGIVVQKLFKSRLRNGIVELSHVIAPFQRCIGQGLEGVGSTFSPRSIIGGQV